MTSLRPCWKFYENQSSVKSLCTTICTYILGFVKIRLILRELEIWLNICFTGVWRHDGHFECSRLPIFKLAHIQGKLKPIVKITCVGQFWLRRNNPDNNSTKIQNDCHGGHLGFSMNEKMTHNQFVHLDDHVYHISCKSDFFEKSPIMMSCRPSWKFYENKSRVK